MKYIDKPLVSCVMLTYNRFSLFVKAVGDYINQDYQNKELIIIDSGNFLYKKKVEKYIESLNIKCKHIKTEKRTIGELRNIGIIHSTGEFIIMFDDDDRHDKNRISYQISFCLQSNITATLLRNFCAVTKTKRSLSSCVNGLDGTILFKNPKDYIRYKNISSGEDTSFIETLKENNLIVVVLDNPHEMYEYHYHGKNTVTNSHFNNFLTKNINTYFESGNQ